MNFTLFPHQISNLERMETLERERVVYGDGYKKDISMGILADRAGSGKTLTVVKLLENDKMFFPKSMTKTVIKTFADYKITKTENILQETVNTNIVFCNPQVCQLWKRHLDKTNLKTLLLIENKLLYGLEFENYQVIIAPYTNYGSIANRLENFCVKRVIYDDPYSTTICNLTISAGFSWYISGYINSISRKFLTGYCNGYIYEDIQKTYEDVIVSSFVSFGENPEIFNWQCYEHCNNLMRNNISQTNFELLQNGDFITFMKNVGGNIGTKNDVIKGVINYILYKINCIDEFLSINDDGRVADEIIEARIQKRHAMELSLASIPKRITESLNGECFICYDKISNPMLCKCCQTVFCSKCLLVDWVVKKNSCPHCRESLKCASTLSLITDEEIGERPRLMTRTDHLEEIVKNPGKFLIFTNVEKMNLKHCLSCYGIQHAEIKPDLKSFKKFTDGKVNVLISTKEENLLGMNIPEITDVIFYYPTTPLVADKVLSCVRRIDKKDGFRVHILT